MSHELDFSTGEAAIAYAGKTPWHQYGEQLEPGQPIEKWAQAARLDWTVHKQQSGFMLGDKFQAVEDQFHLVRDDTFASLGHFSGGYQPVQPMDVLAFFRDYVNEAGGFQLETAGALKGGRVVWALARYVGDSIKIAGDDHGQFIGLATSFDGSMATTAQGTLIRWVCNNTVTAGMMDKRAVVKVRHNTKWTAPKRDQVAKELEIVLQGVADYKAMGERMARTRMEGEDFRRFFKACLDIPFDAPADAVSARKRNTFEALVQSLGQTYAEGTERNTQWAALQAVTRFVDHDRGTRATGSDTEAGSRLYAANFGGGASLKAKAIELLQAA